MLIRRVKSAIDSHWAKHGLSESYLLALAFDVPGEGAIIILLLFVLMAIGAVIMDALGKRCSFLMQLDGIMYFRCLW